MVNLKDIFELHNGVPSLNKRVANRVIKACKCFNVDYGNYHSTNKRTTECLVGALNKELTTTDDTVSYKEAVRACLQKINNNENTRTTNKDIEQITENILGLSKENLKVELLNKNKKYELIKKLLINNNNLSLCSKFCFHLALAHYGKDCGYSKYDNIVKRNLYHYKDLVNIPIKKTEFEARNIDTYVEYCNYIGKLCKKTKLTRNEIDQIIWSYFRQIKE